MSLLYVQEHVTCKNYVSDFKVGFNYTECKKEGYIRLSDRYFNYIVFVLDGELSVSSREYTNKIVQKGEMVFFSQDSDPVGEAITDVKYLLLSFDNQFTLCDQCTLESLTGHDVPHEPLVKLDIRQPLQMVLDTILFFLTNKIQCKNLHAIKQKEVFLIFRTFYTKEEMANFMSPILSRDLDFKTFILKHYQDVKTVEELADLCGMSVRSFNRKFNEQFGDSPYSWILKQRSRHIKKRLADGKTPFAQIIKEFDFSSPAHFTTYCKKQFGINPMKLRRQLLAQNEVAGK